MKTLIKTLLIVGVLTGLGAAIYFPSAKYIAERNKPLWRTMTVSSGDIIQSVNSTGKVEPIRRVSVGASVSGPIKELMVDYNSKVTKGQVMARIDARLYKSSVERDEAFLKTRKAEVERANAFLQQAQNDERRGNSLRKAKNDFISEAELDQFKFNRMTREADLMVASTNIEQAQAQLDNSLANLGYTEILAPCDGVVIDKKIDIGQTLAAQFQTPEMFVVAPELEKRVHIYASVDEADIGLIQKAQSEGEVVRFTVDAYPDDLFDQGKIVQVRLSSKEEQNVITYPVIVESPNPDLKLLPGMTANISFQISKRDKVKKIPNSALRYFPERVRVHPDDYAVLDGVDEQKQSAAETSRMISAEEKNASNRAQSSRHVWIWDGTFLRARAVTTGISDNRYTELVSGDLDEGDELVVGEKPKV